MNRTFDLSSVTTQGKSGCSLKFIPAKSFNIEEKKPSENAESDKGDLINANSIFFEDHLRP